MDALLGRDGGLRFDRYRQCLFSINDGLKDAEEEGVLRVHIRKAAQEGKAGKAAVMKAFAWATSSPEGRGATDR